MILTALFCMAKVDIEVDCYKEEFKRFKKKSTDLEDVIDFRNHDQIQKLKIEQSIHCDESDNYRADVLGLRPPSEWNTFSLPIIPGLLILPNLFIEGGQHYWVRRCLVDYPSKPNICNLDAYEQRSGDGRLWPYAQPDGSRETGHLAPPKPKKAKPSEEERKCSPISKKSSLYRLRWVTLGYHYNWNTKEYNSEVKSTFPPDLSNLSSFILHHAGFPGFNAEAAIVNYYHLDSCLNGHTDHSEKDLTQPLLSISFGQAAIFLVGGKNKQVKPVPLLLNSGDVVIMSGDARLAYHGVPRILPPSEEEQVPASLTVSAIKHGLCHFNKDETVFTESTSKDGIVACCSESPPIKCPHCCELHSMWPHFITYLSVSRININVRQVVSDKYHF